jgi:hypothetical protein
MVDELDPAVRVLRWRMAAYKLHSMRDARETTKAARAAFEDRFAREVDPTGSSPRRSEHDARRPPEGLLHEALVSQCQGPEGQAPHGCPQGQRSAHRRGERPSGVRADHGISNRHGIELRDRLLGTHVAESADVS